MLTFKVECKSTTVLSLKKGKNIAAVMIDMHSKRGSISATGSDYCTVYKKRIPVIYLDPEDAMHLKSGLENELTALSFPQFMGWDIFCANISKYTLSICFWKH